MANASASRSVARNAGQCRIGSARQFLKSSAPLSTTDNVQRCQGNSAKLCRRPFAVGEVGVEGLVDPAVDSPGDPVEASQQALVVELQVAMEAPMEVVMEEATSVGEELQLHSGLAEVMVDNQKALEHQQVADG